MPELGEHSGANKKLLENATYGLSALKDLIDAISTALTFEHQVDAELDEDNPVSGTKYGVGTLGTAQEKVRILSIAFQCTWTGQPTPLEIHLTIDGNTLLASKTDPATATWYYVVQRGTQNPYVTTSAFEDRRAFLMEGRSVKIEAEVTGGTVSNLTCRVKWAKR